MIECTRGELERQGFMIIPGFVEGIAYREDVYGWYAILPNEAAFLTMKLSGNVYFPHRARDINGKDWGEPELLILEKDGLEPESVQELLEILSGRDVSRERVA